MTTCDRLRGHWGRGTYPLCACPIPPDSPEAKTTPEQFATLVTLGEKLAVGTITEAETSTYFEAWDAAFPQFTRRYRTLRRAA